MNLTSIIFAGTTGASLLALVFLIFSYVSKVKKLSSVEEEKLALQMAFDELKTNFTVLTRNFDELVKANAAKDTVVEIEISLRKKAEAKRDEYLRKVAESMSPGELADKFNELLQELSKTDHSTTPSSSGNK